MISPVSGWLAQLAATGITIRLDDDVIVSRGPRGALTPNLLTELRRRKFEIVAELRQPAQRLIAEDAIGGHAPIRDSEFSSPRCLEQRQPGTVGFASKCQFADAVDTSPCADRHQPNATVNRTLTQRSIDWCKRTIGVLPTAALRMSPPIAPALVDAGIVSHEPVQPDRNRLAIGRSNPAVTQSGSEMRASPIGTPSQSVDATMAAIAFMHWTQIHGLCRKWSADDIWFLASEDFAPANDIILPPRPDFLGALRRHPGVTVGVGPQGGEDYNLLAPDLRNQTPK